MGNCPFASFVAMLLTLFAMLLSPSTSYGAEWVDLGLADYPASTQGPVEPIVRYRWNEGSLTPDEHRLGVRIRAPERGRIETELARIKQLTQFEWHSSGFRWDSSAMCGPQASKDRASGWRCIYAVMSQMSEPGVAVVSERFRKQILAGRIDPLQAASLVVSFVQEIPYSEVADQLFGVLPPTLVVHESRGDCDSKSLLAHLLLAAVGIESHILLSDAHQHAMLAVRLPGPGIERRIAGRRFLVVEMTSRWPIGKVDPGLMTPDDWFTVQVVKPDGSGRTQNSANPAPPADASPPGPALPEWSADDVRGFIDRIVAVLVVLLRVLIGLVSGLLTSAGN